MNTVLIVGLATLGVVVSLVLGLVALRHQRVRLVGSIVAIVLAATSALAALWGVGLLLRATAPVPDDVLLFGESSHSVIALKASAATTRWSFSLPNSVSPRNLVMQDGVVYASTDSGVYALASNDGHQLWHSPTAIIVQAGSVGNGVIFGSSSIAIESTNQFAAINVSNGQQLWQVPASIASEPVIVSNLVPVSGLVLVGTEQVGAEHSEVMALDQASGYQTWKIPFTAGPVLCLTAGSDGTVYGAAQRFGGQPSMAFALNPLTRTLLWQHPLSDFPQPILTINGCALYVGTGPSIVALDAGSGNEIWHVDLGHNTGTSSIAIDQGVVYSGAIGAFYVLRASDGSLIWKHTDNANVGFGTPLVSHGVVFSQTRQVGPAPFFSLDTGQHVYAFRASDGQQYYRY
jgi:outer membrane protein assembly factor BamB